MIICIVTYTQNSEKWRRSMGEDEEKIEIELENETYGLNN